MNVAAYARKAYRAALSDRWEADHYVKNAAARAKKTAKKEATRAIRRSAASHISDY